MDSIKQQYHARNQVMQAGIIITSDSNIKELLEKAQTIAIVGLSPKPERDSYIVAGYLKQQGYRIVPVRPGQKEILGEKAYSSLVEIQEPVDIVDVFRSSDKILPHAREALRLKPKVFWMQLNIENAEAAELLTSSNIDVVMNRCIKIEHERFIR
ncbi:CoA-binding protein [Thermodesulfobacteriota bacterium]